MSWSGDDEYLFREGSHFRLWKHLGAHLEERDGRQGARFAVWAPNAERLSVIGDFNGWRKDASPLARLPGSGVWAGFVEGARSGQAYKLHLRSLYDGYECDRADPFAVRSEVPPRQASIIWGLGYDWQDAAWLEARRRRPALDGPMSIYELHLGSWRRGPAGRPLGYRELAPQLADHVDSLGFTHVELMPVMEHPYAPSWGYQTTGYFAATSRHGTPQDLMFLIDTLHQRGIGVLLDWVPSHFPADRHALAFFDGTHLYEHADPRRGIQPDWDSLIFNVARGEVQSFLISSARFWIEQFHVDGLRVDAVASMLYLDYSRRDGEWIPNPRGGRENLEAVAFLSRLNDEVHREHPDVLMVAEESTAWPGVTRPTAEGGLGFDLKWDMGWMNDTLRYFELDPLARKHNHQLLTFRPMYAHSERFVLALSHDEVVHGKGSLAGKMPGDRRARLAQLRLLLGNAFAQPGKKLLFMGAELGQWSEWNHDGELDWSLLEHADHAGVARWLSDLNRLYRAEPALSAGDFRRDGFTWIDCADVDQSVVSFLRRGRPEDPLLLFVLNCTPVVRRSYRLGVPRGGRWSEILNSDAAVYGGNGAGNLGVVTARRFDTHGQAATLELTLPGLSLLVLRGPSPSGRRNELVPRRARRVGSRLRPPDHRRCPPRHCLPATLRRPTRRRDRKR